MEGNRQMVLTVLEGGEPKMTARLASARMAELTKNLGEVVCQQIAGKPHTAMTSSRA